MNTFVVLKKYKLTFASTILIFIAVLVPFHTIPKIETAFFPLDKLVHFLMFFTWSVCFAFERKMAQLQHIKYVLIYLLGVLFAFLTEALQLLTKDRSFDLLDAIFDVIGISVGLLLFYLALKSRLKI